jgi:hypothetical protein
MITGFEGTGFPFLLLPADVVAAWEVEAPAAARLSVLVDAAGGDDSLAFWRPSNSAW